MSAPGMPSPASRENGKLGGRPKATATLLAQKFREALAKDVMAKKDEWIAALEPKALKGDVQAWNAVMDRAFGKPSQPISGDLDSPFVVKLDNFSDEQLTRIAERHQTT